MQRKDERKRNNLPRVLRPTLSHDLGFNSVCCFSATHPVYLYNSLFRVSVCACGQVCAEVRNSSTTLALRSHVRLHPLRVSVGIVGMLRGVREARGAAVFA